MYQSPPPLVAPFTPESVIATKKEPLPRGSFFSLSASTDTLVNNPECAS